MPARSGLPELTARLQVGHGTFPRQMPINRFLRRGGSQPPRPGAMTA